MPAGIVFLKAAEPPAPSPASPPAEQEDAAAAPPAPLSPLAEASDGFVAAGSAAAAAAAVDGEAHSREAAADTEVMSDGGDSLDDVPLLGSAPPSPLPLPLAAPRAQPLSTGSPVAADDASCSGAGRAEARAPSAPRPRVPPLLLIPAPPGSEPGRAAPLPGGLAIPEAATTPVHGLLSARQAGGGAGGLSGAATPRGAPTPRSLAGIMRASQGDVSRLLNEVRV